MITSSENLEPSRAYPIVQPVLRPAAVAYQVQVPYIPTPAQLAQIPNFGNYNGQITSIQSYPPQPGEKDQISFRSNIPANTESNQYQNKNDQIPYQTNGIASNQYQPINIGAAAFIKPEQYQPVEQYQPKTYQNVEQVQPHIEQNRGNYPINYEKGVPADNIETQQQYRGDILNNNYKHRNPEIPDVPPPPLPTRRKVPQQIQNSPNVQETKH